MRTQAGPWLWATLVGTVVVLAIGTGCSRNHYRVRADNDAYARLREKTTGAPWMPPQDFSVYPAPHSRLYDVSKFDDPCLPIPSPQLYAYELPPPTARDRARFTPFHEETEENSREPFAPEVLPDPPEPETDSHAAPGTKSGTTYRSVAFQPQESQVNSALSADPRGGQSPPVPQGSTPQQLWQPVGLGTPEDGSKEIMLTAIRPSQVTGTPPASAAENPPLDVEPAAPFDDAPRTTQVALPEDYWNSIPPDCLSRMLEFESVRQEYQATFGEPPSASLLDDSPRLALEDIIELTLLNSRELQAQKEQLYRAALALTLERFDYQLKPSLGANGADVDYTHSRSGGTTSDGLRIPTTLQLDKMLYTGGDFLGRFANDVLLTFNGPQGFAVDVGSELLFNFSQSLLQRDVRLENLTQAERNVVYAARDFTRFRRELFVQQASEYYSLIRQYRQVEIECQNYFTLAREFNQRSVEIKFGMAARTQLDQVEQQVINGRQSILSTCTSLENALDSLKIRMGLPTEQLLNLDLSELNMLTLRDELAVNGELIERTRLRILRELESDARSAFVLIGSLAQLVDQMLNSYILRESLGEEMPDATPLENILLELRIEAADIDVAEDRTDLDAELREPAPDRIKVIQRRRDVADELLKKVAWQIRLLRRTTDDDATSEVRWQQLSQLSDRLTQLANRFQQAMFAEEQGEPTDTIEVQLAAEAESLQRALEAMVLELDRALGRPESLDRDAFMNRAIAYSDELLGSTMSFREAAGAGLVPIHIEMDDAMMTALVQRFDLMNERGFLADDWRQIKYAADDLRSVLNLQASQSIRTRSGQNRPFDFTFDESTTSAGLTFDLPFNRRAQRNGYRTALFDYQAALRRIMQLEDNIKLSVRRDLRSLTLDRQQYANDIAGAALASERVTGTELEVRGGFATSRDFLESQTAYVRAVSNVASRHINYIVGRLQLFLDLESLTLDANGFWDQLYVEDHQPEPRYELSRHEKSAYGELHPRLRYSSRIRRMECVPMGTSMIYRYDEDTSASDPEANGVE